MTNLSDTQLLILNGAATNGGHNILPISKSVRAFGISLRRAIENLEEAQLIVRQPARHDEPNYKNAEGSIFKFVITTAGMSAIGIEPEETEEVVTMEPKTKEQVAAEKLAEKEASKAAKEAEREAAKAAKEAEREAAKAAKEAGKEAAAAEKAKLAEELAEKRAAAAAEKEASKAAKLAEREAAKAAKEAEREAAKASAGDGDKKAGRAPSNKGKSLFPLCTENPRRIGSWGHQSMQIILDSPGISYEEFIKAGGRSNDLGWDIDHGNVEARFVAAV